jgi:hypothetical protein
MSLSDYKYLFKYSSFALWRTTRSYQLMQVITRWQQRSRLRLTYNSPLLLEAPKSDQFDEMQQQDQYREQSSPQLIKEEMQSRERLLKESFLDSEKYNDSDSWEFIAEKISSIKAPELIAGLDITSEKAIDEIINHKTERDKTVKRRNLRILLEQAFMCVTLDSDIERLALEVAARISKIHYNRFVKAVWCESTEKRRREALKTVFVISYVDNSTYFPFINLRINRRKLISNIWPKDGVVLGDLWALSDVLLSKEVRPSMEMTYLSLVHDVYQRRIWSLQLEQLRAQAEKARTALKQLDEKVKGAKQVVVDSKVMLDQKVVSGFSSLRQDVDKLHDHIKQIEDHNQKIEVIESELDDIFNNGFAEELFNQKKAKLVQLNQELEAKQDKSNALIEAASAYFLKRLTVCEKQITELKIKISCENNPIKGIEKEIAIAQSALIEVKSAKLDATSFFVKTRDQRMQQIKEKQIVLKEKREHLRLTQKELIQAQYEVRAEGEHRQEIESSLKEVKSFLKDLREKGEGIAKERITTLSENESKLSIMYLSSIELQKKLDKILQQKEAEINLLEEELSLNEKGIWTSVEELLVACKSLDARSIEQIKKLAELKAKIKWLLEQLNLAKINFSKTKQKHQETLVNLNEEMECLGRLLSMVLNLPLDIQGRMIRLKLAEEEVVSTISVTEAKEGTLVAEAEKQVVIFDREVSEILPKGANFKALKKEVGEIIVQLNTEAEKIKKQITEIEVIDAEMIINECGVVTRFQQASDELKAIRQKNAAEVVDALVVIQEITKRSEQMQNVAKEVSSELSQVLANLQAIKEIGDEAQLALVNLYRAKLTSYEREVVTILLTILIDLQNRQKKLSNFWYLRIFQSVVKTQNKINALQSTILILIQTLEETNRKNFFAQCVAILQWKRSVYSRYWYIGWIIDWFLSGVKTTSTKVYDQLIAQLGPKEAYKDNEDGSDVKRYHQLLFRAMENAVECPNFIAMAQENQRIFLHFGVNKLKAIEAFKTAILEFEGKLIIYRGHAISLTRVCEDESEMVEIEARVAALDDIFGELHCLETKIEMQEKIFGEFNRKIETGTDLFLKQEEFLAEAEKIAANFKSLVEQGEKIKREINVVMTSRPVQRAKLPVHCIGREIFKLDAIKKRGGLDEKKRQSIIAAVDAVRLM